MAPVIAIIDDDKSVREATAGLLQPHGYEAVSFASAEDFLQSGILCRTACLISDVRMPGMSGLDLHARLLKAGTSAPTIFMTAFATDEVRRQALEQGAFGILKKPFDESALMECLGSALLARQRNNAGDESKSD